MSIPIHTAILGSVLVVLVACGDHRPTAPAAIAPSPVAVKPAPVDPRLVSECHDPQGHVLSQIYEDGIHVNYTYDQQGRIVGITCDDGDIMGQQFLIAYAADGSVQQMCDPQGNKVSLEPGTDHAVARAIQAWLNTVRVTPQGPVL